MEETPKKPIRWLHGVLILGLLWGQFIQAVGTIKNPTPNNRTTFCAIEMAGLYTLLLFLTRRWWLLLKPSGKSAEWTAGTGLSDIPALTG